MQAPHDRGLDARILLLNHFELKVHINIIDLLFEGDDGLIQFYPMNTVLFEFIIVLDMFLVFRRIEVYLILQNP